MKTITQSYQWSVQFYRWRFTHRTHSYLVYWSLVFPRIYFRYATARTINKCLKYNYRWQYQNLFSFKHNWKSTKYFSTNVHDKHTHLANKVRWICGVSTETLNQIKIKELKYIYISIFLFKSNALNFFAMSQS